MKTSSLPQRGMWAPGNYACKCSNCGCTFCGDKRAVACFECAYGNANITEDALRQRIKELEEALTPSADTKAAYIGEFEFWCSMPVYDEDGELREAGLISVPWTTIKEIMKAIRERAER